MGDGPHLRCPSGVVRVEAAAALVMLARGKAD